MPTFLSKRCRILEVSPAVLADIRLMVKVVASLLQCSRDAYAVHKRRELISFD